MKNKNRISKFNSRRYQYGFTLVELLVVISVIGLIASIVTISLSDARARARDSRRVSDTRQLITALSIDYDNTGRFPCHAPFDQSTNSNYLQPLRDHGIISLQVKDPLNSGNYTYNYMTFKDAVGGPCGQIAYMDYTTERPITECIAGGILINTNHCHIFIPRQPNCPDLEDDGDLAGCDVRDTVNEY